MTGNHVPGEYPSGERNIYDNFQELVAKSAIAGYRAFGLKLVPD